jgi:hypothetical protein
MVMVNVQDLNVIVTEIGLDSSAKFNYVHRIVMIRENVMKENVFVIHLGQESFVIFQLALKIVMDMVFVRNLMNVLVSKAGKERYVIKNM